MLNSHSGVAEKVSLKLTSRPTLLPLWASSPSWSLSLLCGTSTPVLALSLPYETLSLRAPPPPPYGVRGGLRH